MMLMAVMEVGRVCVKTAGRNAGRYCVITKVLGSGSVEITGPKKLTGVKRGKCSMAHLEPARHVIKLGKRASEADVEKAVKAAKLGKMMAAGVKL